jgi:hypothetical protein
VHLNLLRKRIFEGDKIEHELDAKGESDGGHMVSLSSPMRPVLGQLGVTTQCARGLELNVSKPIGKEITHEPVTTLARVEKFAWMRIPTLVLRLGGRESQILALWRNRITGNLRAS